MKATLPPYDGMVWCRWINNGEGGYLPRDECEHWHNGYWYPLQVTHLLRTIRGVTAEEMDRRTQSTGRPMTSGGDTVRERIKDIREGYFPGG